METTATKNFTYITNQTNDKTTQQFYIMPKFIFESNLSSHAKLLYAYALDRCKLSKKNYYWDLHGKVYIILPIKSIQNILNCSKNTATKVLDELKTMGLIEILKGGFAKANKIFVKYPISETVTNDEKKQDTSEKSNNEQNSDTPKKFDIKKEDDIKKTNKLQNMDNGESYPQSYPQDDIQEHDYSNRNGQNLGVSSSLSQFLTLLSQKLTPLSQILGTINTEFINNFKNNKYIYISNPSNLSNTDMIDSEKICDDYFYTYQTYKKKIKENINYKKLKYGFIQQSVDNIVDHIATIMISKDKIIYVNKQPQPAEVVKDTLMKLREEHISYALESMQNLAISKNTKIKNMRSYLTTVLFNSYTTAYLYDIYTPEIYRSYCPGEKGKVRSLEYLEKFVEDENECDDDIAIGEDGHIMRDKDGKILRVKDLKQQATT